MKSAQSCFVQCVFQGPFRALFTALVIAASFGAAWGETESAKLTASNGSADDEFGFEVNIDGDTAIVSAAHSGVGQAKGHAYIFTRCNSGWTQQSELVSSDSSNGDIFGWSVAISGDTAVVTAAGANFYNANKAIPNTEKSNTAVGSAYVFVRNDGVWTQQAKLLPGNGTADDQYGFDAWISGDTIIVGAPHDNEAAFDAGAAYVYTRTNGVWTQQAKLVANDARDATEFGRGVCIDGDTVVIGAARYNTSRLSQGANKAYVFTRSGNTWKQEAELQSNTPTQNDLFGITVSLSGDTVLVGAQIHNTVFGDTGAGYVFTRMGTTWTQQAILTPPDLAPGDDFGFSSGLYGDLAVLGSVSGSTEDGGRDGKAYLFERSGNSWIQTKELNASDGRDGDQFGNSVAISGDTALVGAVFSDTLAGVNVGSAYILDIGLQDPKITSTFPIKGTSIPDATVNLYIAQSPCDTPTLLSTTTSTSIGSFLDLTDLAPYVGSYIFAQAINTSSQTTHYSVPLLIGSPCIAPVAPSAPSPADASTIAASSATLTWTESPAKVTTQKSWENDGGDCATPLDLTAVVPAGNPWDGQTFANDGVTFATTTGAHLYVTSEGSPGSNLYAASDKVSDSPVFAVFDRSVFCVSLDIYGFQPDNPNSWRVYAFDGTGGLLSTASGTDQFRHLRLQAPGIRLVEFVPSRSNEILTSFSFKAYDCAVTYDVMFGTSPIFLSTLCSGVSETRCQSPALAFGQQYYWQVIAKNTSGASPGPIWKFTNLPQILARDDAFAFPKDSPAQILNVLANDVSPVPLSIASFTLPSSGQLRENTDNTFTYVPVAGFVGKTHFTYTLHGNGTNNILTATVTITITNSNHAPIVAHPIPDIKVPINAGVQGINAGLVFSDPDGDPLTFTVTQNSNPSLVSITPSGAGFVLAYTPGATGTCNVTLRATDPGSLFAEDAFLITVGATVAPPAITSQPVSLTVDFGATAQFTCAATSQTLLAYQWQKNQTDLNNNAKFSGVTTPQLGIAACRNVEEGDYRCRISDGTTSLYTNAATLGVRDPIIVAQPLDTVGGVGGTAAFSVTATGTGTLAYQWFIGATALADGSKYYGATSARLTIRDLIDLPNNTDEQYYHCEIRGGDPAPVISRSAVLIVGDPAITIQPTPQTVRHGTTATFSLVAIGSPPLIYRWRKNGILIDDSARIFGTRTPSLSISDTTRADEADYSCTVIGHEIVNSGAAHLNVTQIPAITGLIVSPTGGILSHNASFTIGVLLDGPATGLNISWEHDGLPLADSARISGSTITLLNITQATTADNGNYFCKINDGVEFLTSPAVPIHVGLAFLVDLADAALEDGQHFDWNTQTAGRTGPTTYAWFRQGPSKSIQPIHDNGRISGSDTNALTIDPVLFSDAGPYIVYASDTTDTVTSRTATLTVSANVPLTSALGIATLTAALALTALRPRRRRPQN